MLFNISARFKHKDFNPQMNIPALDGKVILVTGANSGLGKASVLEFARHKPERVWLAARSVAKGEAALREIEAVVPDAARSIKVLQLDLSSFTSIQAGADKVINESGGVLDILMLNAGIMASAERVTEEGYEVQFGTNHVGHALLTSLLLPSLGRALDARVVTVASAAYKDAPTPEGIRFDTLKGTAKDITTIERYGQSKLANILFTLELAKRYPTITAAVIDPGAVRTNLNDSMTGLTPMERKMDAFVSRWFYKRADEGARNQLWAATCKAGSYESGEYMEPVGLRGKAEGKASDEELARKLWEWTKMELEECLERKDAERVA